MKSLSIKSPKEEITQALKTCRQRTLFLTCGLDFETLTRQAHPDFSPIGWHLGHIAFTEAYWILEKLAGSAPLFPVYQTLFAADGLPKRARQNLPSWNEIKSYLDLVRLKTLDYLASADLSEQLRLWWWLVQHESQHGETIAIIKKLHTTSKLSLRKFQEKTSNSPCFYENLEDQPQIREIAAGEFVMGSNDIKAQDNERPAHPVYLDSYSIDTYPVAIAEYQNFIDSQGYQVAKYWSDEGWQWLQQTKITRPLYWFDAPQNKHHPVFGVSYYEAEAYAKFIGKRLPTEAEWEKAAQSNLIRNSKAINTDSSTQTNQRAYRMLGYVWEWTSSWFAPYPNFSSFPYEGYSQTYFDDRHRVLKGGSFATQPWAMRPSFRNWYHPWVRQIFAGFRCVQDSYDND